MVDTAHLTSWMLQRSIWLNWHLEHRLDYRPKKLTGVPGDPEHLTREWLSAAMCKDVPGAEVVGFDRGDSTNGSNFRERLTLHYNDIGTQAGLPTTTFTKSAATLSGRKMTGITGTRRAEAMFYSQLRPNLELDSPVAYHSAFHQASGRGMILLEDLAATRGAKFGSPVDLSIDLETAKAQLSQIAVYHAKFWNTPFAEGRRAWLKPREDFYNLLQAVFDCEKAVVLGVERSLHVLPEELHSKGAEIWATMLASLRLEATGGRPRTLSHCDVHVGNWFFTPDGKPGLYDWGTVVGGNPGVDVAYAMTSALTVTDRRAWEDELLQHYVSELGARGIEITTDDAWTWVKEQVPHALFNWLFTIGVKPETPSSSSQGAPDMQPDDVCFANIERMAAAVADWKTQSLLMR